ncbi:hypothetical protein [Sphingobacterium multivorum]|uniref:hypothetical protein n=1 Tax=Sphingobacterium multivorum TaxID=28454 RepID=UPI0028AF3E5B|nr:hypothetical protein [Sphingobacterium multivorum]
MYEYTLNGIPFSDYGITESQIQGSNVALEGAWDMPSRMGKTFYDWGDEDGIEPYLRADEIFIGGRDIKFVGFIQGESRESVLENIDDFFSSIDESVLMELSGDLGTWMVYIGSEVSVEYHYEDNFATVEFTFREPVVTIENVDFPVADNANESIDNMSWDSLGVTLLSLKNDLNRPNIKSRQVTAYGIERYEGSKRGFRQLEFKAIIIQPDYESFKIVLNRLYKLFKSPNARTLKMPDGTVREVFVKDGFQITNLTIEEGEVIAELDITFCEIRQLQNWNKLTDSSGLILVDKHGQSISEISKKF